MKDRDKLIQCVKNGALHKVKRCLKKWKKEGKSINDVKTGSGRTLLHLACYHGEDAVARALLRAGCSANCLDKDDNTPIHLALNRVLEGDNNLLNDLVESLLLNATSDEIMQKQRNGLGVTPALLLTRARSHVAESKKASSSQGASWQNEEQDFNRDWNDKLADEYAYEHMQMNDDRYWTSMLTTVTSLTIFYLNTCSLKTMLRDFTAQYVGRLIGFNGQNHCQNETYDEWAERMSSEYHTKQDHQKHSRQKSKKTKEKSTNNDKLLRKLQKDHEKYLEKQKEKAAMKLKRNKEEYLLISEHFFNNNNDDSKVLQYEDIPWPGQRSDVTGMLEVLQCGVETKSLKKFVLTQLRFWHPDKFQQKFGERLHKDSEQILKQVNALSQGLNKLIEDIPS
ncbi:uncharacterized protein [Antedon mediterranea]|uniref:uncharacterized protein isoform X1 n=1 Tax=Antedon mediterranea TaxID=105859 RepID=UPI003AF7DD1C